MSGVSRVTGASTARGRDTWGVISLLVMNGGRKHLMPYLIRCSDARTYVLLDFSSRSWLYTLYTPRLRFRPTYTVSITRCY